MTIDQSKLGIGVIGVGIQGKSHLDCYHADPRVEIRAIADVNEQTLQERKAEFGVGRTFTDYRDLLACDDVQAVTIATPDHFHREPAVAAFGAGKHVLLEKPMATVLEDAEAMLAAAKRSGQKFMINLSNRWMPAFAQTKEALDRGDLGDPKYIYARLSNTLWVPTKMLTWAGESALPHWLMVHRLDIARWFIGREAKRVNAVCRYGVLSGMGVNTPDFYQATVEFEDDIVGNFEHCWILPESLPYLVDSKFQLVCTKGYALIDPVQPGFRMATAEEHKQPSTLYCQVLGEPVGFVRQAIKHFVTCVVEDKEPLITGEDGLALTKTLCAVVQSAKEGRPVDL